MGGRGSTRRSDSCWNSATVGTSPGIPVGAVTAEKDAEHKKEEMTRHLGAMQAEHADFVQSFRTQEEASTQQMSRLRAEALRHAADRDLVVARAQEATQRVEAEKVALEPRCSGLLAEQKILREREGMNTAWRPRGPETRRNSND